MSIGLKDKPGALSAILRIFAEAGINLLLISSSFDRQGTPHFLVDFEGHVNDAKVQGVMDALETEKGKSGELDVQIGLMRVPLLRHQKQALRWMLDRERSIAPKGGILADDQGLGKTVTTMSLLVTTSADSRDWLMRTRQEWTPPTPGTGPEGQPPVHKGGTLVVCPTSILRQ